MPAEKKYPHRVNLDGSWDSICTRCFLTIAHCKTEKELAEVERKHVCDSSVLAERDIFRTRVLNSERKAS